MDEIEMGRLLECLEMVLQQQARLDLRLERLALEIMRQNREQMALLRRLLAGQPTYPKPTEVQVIVS